jgi:hypothetical protein
MTQAAPMSHALTSETFASPRAPTDWPPGLQLAAFGLLVAQAVFLATAYASGIWLIDGNGLPIADDFVGFWPAGRMVLDGLGASIWDPVAHKAAGVAALGHDFKGSYPLYYPPHYMLLVALLPLLPYTASYLVWVAVALSAYVFVIGRIIGERFGILLALAFPALLGNIMVGQNGCITAALFGGALLALQRRPVLAGCLIGLLTYKPHFGILIPLALVCAREWRVFVSAAVVALGLAAASWLVLGTAAWEGFFTAIQHANRDTLAGGLHDWSKLQSIFGLTRVAGGSVTLAWLLHGTAVAVMAGFVAVLWSGRQPFALKAAALSVAAVICAPYAYMYDLVLLAVPVAFLLRDGRERDFLPGEMAGLAGACLLLASFPFVKLPVGVGAALIVAGLIARRCLVERAALVPP